MFSSARLKPTLPKSQFPQKFESSFVNSEARQWKWELIECCLQKNWDQLIAKKSWDQLIAKKWDQLIVIKSWDQLIVIKSWDQLIAKKLEPVDCDKKLGPVDCKKMLIAKKSWDQLIPIKGWDQLIAKKDNALFVIRSKTEASIVGLLSQTWGVSFDGRSGKERFPLESFLADK